MQVVNMSASIQSQSGTRSAQSSSRDGTGGINQPSDVCEIYKTVFVSEMYPFIHPLFEDS